MSAGSQILFTLGHSQLAVSLFQSLCQAKLPICNQDMTLLSTFLC